MPRTIYLETTVISYCAARDSTDSRMALRQKTSRETYRRLVAAGEAFASEYVLQEARQGDAQAAIRRLSLLESVSLLPSRPEIVELAREILDAAVLPESAEYDALHLAVASWHGMDCLLTWNCRHLAGDPTRRLLADVNGRRGLPIPEILTPAEFETRL